MPITWKDLFEAWWDRLHTELHIPDERIRIQFKEVAETGYRRAWETGAELMIDELSTQRDLRRTEQDSGYNLLADAVDQLKRVRDTSLGK